MKTRFLASTFVCALVPGFLSHALAGDVKLISDTLETVCQVDIAWGPDAPNGTQLEFHADVRKAWSITKPDKLCYRRASTPDNCESGMTQWKTQWKCATASGTATEELSLK